MKEIKSKKFKEVIYYDECSNGLGIYMWINEKVSNYYATLNVKYGSCDTKFKLKDDKDEKKVPNGIAHFLEHITFNEDNNKTANDYFDKKGTSTNAFTSFDYTSYEIYGNQDIKSDIAHLLDFVQEKVITDEIVEKEKGIIQEEVRMGKNNPGHEFYFETNKAIYKNDNKRFLITGEESDVKKISSKDLNLVFDTFYHPSNMFIVITGNFNPYEMAALIKENQANKKFPKTTSYKLIKDIEVEEVSKPLTKFYGNIEIPKLNLIYKINRKKFKEYTDIYLRIYLNMILNANFGPTSNLKEDLMEKELITYLGSSIDVDKDVVLIKISCETKYPEELINILKDAMNKLSITEERLTRRIKCAIANNIASYDNIEVMNNRIQNNVIYYKKVYADYNDIYRSLNIDDAIKIIKKINLKNEAIVLMLPEKDKEKKL